MDWISHWARAVSSNNIALYILDWALASLSMFNTILLFWLGLTVLLNAEKRAWGIWLAGCGLLLGGVFFAGHTVTLDYRYEELLNQISKWWYPAWLCVILLPYGWYVLMLWYNAFWDGTNPRLRRRHRLWFPLLTASCLALMGLLTAVNPFRVLKQMVQLDSASLLSGLPWLVMFYPIYLVMCGAFAINALRYPAHSDRLMGDIARHRARPWLIASSVVQFAVSLLLASVLLWMVQRIFESRIDLVVNTLYIATNFLDLVTTALIAVAIVLMGKAIVSYEIFTGKTLPRRGFLRQWRNIVGLSAAYSLLVCLAWALPIPPAYPLILTSILLSVSYALFSWRSYAEREDYMDHLRPFVASQNLYGHMLARATPESTLHGTLLSLENDTLPDVATGPQFQALCEGVLNASVAYLMPLGSMAPLAGTPLAYPDPRPPVLPPLDELTARFRSPQQLCAPLDPDRWAGAMWAVSLWSERGLIGVLLLGEKRDFGLYAQEEIEIARASGERLLDAQAGATMAQRLMSLQRQRLAESQLLDRRARRVLHDEILPRLHAAMLSLSSSTTNESTEAVKQLSEVHREISNMLREMPLSTTPEFGRRGLIGALRDAIAHEFKDDFDEVQWNVSPEAEARARHLAPLTAEVLFYATRETVRNAARYGRDEENPRTFVLSIDVTLHDEHLQVVVEDDGVGIGLANASQGGSGQGLALHSTMLAVVGGSLSIESSPHQFTRATLTLPPHAMSMQTESHTEVVIS
jgi:signal transduction histidine kinase